MPEQKQITIEGEQFNVTVPYAEGAVLTAAEARTLNQTRCENVRNNTAKKVRELVAAGDLAGAQAHVAEYDSNYTFAMPGTGGGTRVVRDPVEREARSIAREAIKAKLAGEGRKLKDVDETKLEDALAKLAARDDIVKLAKKRVKDRQNAIDQGLEGIAL